MKKTLVIVPAYNEGPSLKKVIEDIYQRAPFVDVVVINDASTDDTAQVARQTQATVLSLPINLGIGGAVQTGFRYAVAKGYTWTLQIDGDGQHDPSYIADLITPLEAGEADCVIGSRYVQQTSYKTPFARRIGMILFSNILSALIDYRITDTTSGFRALNPTATRFFAQHYPVDFPDAEALLLLHQHGMRLCEVPVTMRPRAHGKSSINLWKSIYYPFKSLTAIFAALLRARKT